MNYTFLIAVELTCWSKVKKQFTFVNSYNSYNSYMHGITSSTVSSAMNEKT